MKSNPIQLSVAIITLNEERNIERCIRSVQPVADEIVVVDSYSTDRTKEICLALGVRFLENKFVGHIEQKNFAVDCTLHSYVLSLDADEALSEELQNSIIWLKENNPAYAYRFNRLTNYCGQWIRHCGWYPDAKTRLWKKSVGHWGGINPHDSVILNEGISPRWVTGNILHFSYYSIEEHVIQINKFSSISSRENLRKGKKVIPIVHFFLYPLFTFISRYIFYRGFLDGYMGFVVCKNAAFFKYLKYAKLYALKQQA